MLSLVVVATFVLVYWVSEDSTTIVSAVSIQATTLQVGNNCKVKKYAYCLAKIAGIGKVFKHTLKSILTVFLYKI